MFTENFIHTAQEVTFSMVDAADKARAASTDKESKKAATVTKPRIMRAIGEKIGNAKISEMSDLALSNIFSTLQEMGYLNGLRCVQGPYGGVQYEKRPVKAETEGE